MTEKEIKSLSRLELLNILVEQGKENDLLKANLEELKSNLEELKAELEEKKIENEEIKEKFKNFEIELNESGTMAEAALKMNYIFESADKAARKYLYTIKKQKKEQEKKLKEAEQIKKALENYIYDVKTKLENFVEKHPEINELFALLNQQGDE